MRTVSSMSCPCFVRQDTISGCHPVLLAVPCDVRTLAPLSLNRFKVARLRSDLFRAFERRCFGCRHTSTQEEI
jgi:hypothetical protein